MLDAVRRWATLGARSTNDLRSRSARATAMSSSRLPPTYMKRQQYPQSLAHHNGVRHRDQSYAPHATGYRRGSWRRPALKSTGIVLAVRNGSAKSLQTTTRLADPRTRLLARSIDIVQIKRWFARRLSGRERRSSGRDRNLQSDILTHAGSRSRRFCATRTPTPLLPRSALPRPMTSTLGETAFFASVCLCPYSEFDEVRRAEDAGADDTNALLGSRHFSRTDDERPQVSFDFDCHGSRATARKILQSLLIHINSCFLMLTLNAR